MRKIYKGYELSAAREKSLGGDPLLYFSIFRKSDGLEISSGFSSGDDSVKDYIGYMKNQVDEFIETKGKSEEMEDDF